MSTIEEYRISEYEKMGFSFDQAVRLADINSLQVADVRNRFIKKGCSPELAWRILEPEWPELPSNWESIPS